MLLNLIGLSLVGALESYPLFLPIDNVPRRFVSFYFSKGVSLQKLKFFSFFSRIVLLTLFFALEFVINELVSTQFNLRV